MPRVARNASRVPGVAPRSSRCRRRIVVHELAVASDPLIVLDIADRLPAIQIPAIEESFGLRPAFGFGALQIRGAESGERQSASGTLAAGEYKVYCALPGHDALGMHATLEVR